MTILNPHNVPAPLLDASSQVERADADNMTVLEVPAAVGWALHANVRSEGRELESHVCASSYDHLNLDLRPPVVSALYEMLPQETTFIGIAGLPGQVSRQEAWRTLLRWGARPFSSLGVLPEPDPLDAYVAAPVFVLYRSGRSVAPIAVVGTRYRVSTPARGQLEVSVTLDALAVAPEIRDRGVGHLLLLEAGRWLGMLTSGLVLHGRRALQLTQHVHGYPTTPRDAHLADVFLKNYAYFSVTDAVIEAARRDRRLGLAQVGSLAYGLAAVERHLGAVDHVRLAPGTPGADPVESGCGLTQLSGVD